ncbi:glucosamine-6-phosphate deaminase [Candidatus Desantisbacteria bacterium CG1_02_38_46]|uniref:Glucosamine-6-phosphate deaminase n=3 Tax=unclassified Candidatus Desantisiibacteriota TaxID=3106372 RepID=A0A2H9PCP7_9BACT|nr:MAG: glucosamine-6-phosphate deaminase [Candidatus Desantisbacteria bacterium CG1_02_38_46]PIU51477.1 MAG: glucosamine-6-phosphate deaminase [Candidatus Desantisbacteria bacterium CG07_land_8_20_14_0_80_39_15]PIZ17077.1 MAG: glucosamine-6-phosphate deaminase [Candidatus Desantisbacteria bacterium CG_4_10_14_0_8_um_filter_39_17]
MQVVIKANYDEISKEAALTVKQRLMEKPSFVLGLATGSTPLGLYKELIRMHKEEGLSFSHMVTFNLDEYLGLAPDHPQSYNFFMWENLFKHININPRNVYIPDGKVKPVDVEEYCEWYESRIKKFGGIDLQILGIGRDGHIGFNEPGSSLGSRTRVKTLTEETMQDNARFFKDPSEVPTYSITMGVGTVMEAKEILMVASGKNKAQVIATAIEGGVTAQVTASVLQLHKKVTVFLDEEAASLLKRKKYYNFVAEAVKKFQAIKES